MVPSWLHTSRGPLRLSDNCQSTFLVNQSQPHYHLNPLRRNNQTTVLDWLTSLFFFFSKALWDSVPTTCYSYSGTLSMAPHGWINGMKLFKYNYLRCGSSRRYYTQVNWPLFLWLACVITGWLEASLPMAPLFPKLYLKTSSSQSPVSNSSYLSISDIHKLHFVLYHSFIHTNVATYSTWNRLLYCEYIYTNST